MEASLSSYKNSLQEIRNRLPLILNITNYVAMDLTANALLAIGASPIMAHAVEEVEDLVNISDSLVINMGTLDSKFIEVAKLSIQCAINKNIPIVFDPVGAGASNYRTQTARDILNNYPITCVRGNASEINALFENKSITKGVDSTLSAEEILQKVKIESLNFKTVFTISGKVDYILCKGEQKCVELGDPVMTRVTAMGCTATSLIGAFLAVNSSAFDSSFYAMTVMGLAGEIAKKVSQGSGSFRTAFIDGLTNL